MPEARVMPNEISYNAAISAYKKAGHWQQVLNLLSLLPIESVVPNEITSRPLSVIAKRANSDSLH